MKGYLRVLFLCLLINYLLVPHTFAKTSEKSRVDGFLDFNLYYDTRNFTVFTLNALANLPARFQYFSLTNLFSPVDSGSLDITNFYTEQHLRWNPYEKVPVDLTMLWTIQSGTQNDTLRFGARWRVTDTKWWKGFFAKIGLFYFINFHPLQIELSPSPGHGWQIEHVYYWKIFPTIFKERLYLSGFADHNMQYNGSTGNDNHIWVTEHQLGYRMIHWLYAVAEFRRNEYIARKNGVGFGLEYKVLFD